MLLLFLSLHRSLVQIKHNHQKRKRVDEEKEISQIFTDHGREIILNVDADVITFSQQNYKICIFQF